MPPATDSPPGSLPTLTRPWDCYCLLAYTIGRGGSAGDVVGIQGGLDNMGVEGSVGIGIQINTPHNPIAL